MIMVDSSVWVDFFRGLKTRENQALQKLIGSGEMLVVTDVIVTEILRGIVSDKEYATVKHHLESFPCLTARAPSTFIHAADLYRTCRKKGATIRSTIDCLIAAVCVENTASLLHHDEDFKRLAAHCDLRLVDPDTVIAPRSG